MIVEICLALLGLFGESVEPAIREEIEVKWRVLRERLGKAEVAPPAGRAANLFQ